MCVFDVSGGDLLIVYCVFVDVFDVWLLVNCKFKMLWEWVVLLLCGFGWCDIGDFKVVLLFV